jgi:hypothetical protein
MVLMIEIAIDISLEVEIIIKQQVLGASLLVENL